MTVRSGDGEAENANSSSSKAAARNKAKKGVPDEPKYQSMSKSINAAVQRQRCLEDAINSLKLVQVGLDVP
jgi:hypothetical protein